jgi:NADH dehydrogenase
MGASESSPLPLFRAKGMVETRVKASGMAWTILQPNAFMDVWFGMLVEAPLFAGQPITLVGESRRRHAFVAERDVAAFAMAAVRHAAAREATIAIGGPEALTLREVVTAYEAAARRTVTIRSVAPGEPIPGVPEAVWGIAAALESFDSPMAMEETARTYGVTLTSVRDFASARVRSATA